MLSNKDLLNIGSQEPVGNIEWICKETGTQLSGGDHIIYLNGAYNDESTEMGKLIHDLKESNPDNIYFPELKQALKNYMLFSSPDRI